MAATSSSFLRLIYEGWNDIHNYHDRNLGADYYTHGLRQYSNLAIQRPRPVSPLAKLADLSVICRLASSLSRKVTAWRDSESDIVDNPAFPTPDRVGNPNPDPVVDRLYLRNLATLKTLGRQQGAFVVFVPQVLDYTRFKGESGSWWTPHVRSSSMARLLDRFNLFMDETCRPHEADCLVLSHITKQRWVSDDFIDEGHFSAKGNLAFARFVAPHVEAIARRILKQSGDERFTDSSFLHSKDHQLASRDEGRTKRRHGQSSIGAVDRARRPVF